MAQALEQVEQGKGSILDGSGGAWDSHATEGAWGSRQLGLYEGQPDRIPGLEQVGRAARVPGTHTRRCAGCRAKEARYGFRPEGVEAHAFDRPRTHCFDCFRMELTRRQLVKERMARGWNAQQVGLPLDETLRGLERRRRRAQIAARHALGV